MNFNTAFTNEITHEAATTRRCLERVPTELFTWKPHPKSYSFGELAGHITEIFGWAPAVLQMPELDFAKYPYKLFMPDTTAHLLESFDANLKEALDALNNTPAEAFFENWSMRDGDNIFFTMPKMACMRGFIVNHFIHHRGQLTGYLRANDIPVPPIYGPTADESV